MLIKSMRARATPAKKEPLWASGKRKELVMNIKAIATVLMINVGAISMAYAAPLEYNPGVLNFSSTNQNMWGSGGGVAPVSRSYSTSWRSSSTIGGITGSAEEVIIPGFDGSDAVYKYIDIPLVVHDHSRNHRHRIHCHKSGCLGYDPHPKFNHTHHNYETHPGYRQEVLLFPAIPAYDATYGDTRTGVEAVLSTSGGTLA